MGYAEYLRALLQPLGVYDLSRDSFSGSELEALGQGMDELQAYAEEKQKDALVTTAGETGLDRFGSLFPHLVTARTVQERRSALAALMSISGDSFTAQSLSRCLAACGTECTVRETAEPFTVEGRFPAYAGVPEAFEAKKRVIESILPCHLAVRYAFSWAAWQDVAALTWDDVKGLSFTELAMWGLEEDK